MKNILVIDDDLHIGNVLEETLINEGYGVIRAYSGTEAVLLLSQVKPDLVLLDLMLPGLSGEEVLPHIKGIPVIIMSAKVDVDNKVALLLGGAVDYMTKPLVMTDNGQEYQELPNPKFLDGGGRKTVQFFYDFLPGGQVVQCTSLETENLSLLPVYSLVIVVLTTSAGMFFFKKKELK